VTETLRLLHVTDLHLHADADRELYGVKTAASFRAVMQQAFADEDWRPAAILVTGDLAEDESSGAYERFRSVMQTYELPVYCIPGNHDDPALMAELLDGDGFQFCGSTGFGDWRIILLNSHVPGDEGGELNDGELLRLESELDRTGGTHALVCVHHQPLPMGSRWIDELGLRNGPELLRILERYTQPRAVLWGHVHQASDRRHGKLRMLSTPSTCAQFTPKTENCVMDLRPPAFRRIELAAHGAIRTEVRWLDDWQVAHRPPDTRVEDQTR
jgi:Icc protein